MDASLNSIVMDTSVVINFLVIDRIDLLAYCSYLFLVTDDVVDEVKYPDQRTCLDAALDAGILHRVRVDNNQEVDMFGRLAESKRLGYGECSAIALAVGRNYMLPIDDGAAIKQARKIAPSLRILTTQDLVVKMIQAGLLSIAEADEIKSTWESRNGFRLPIKSFADLMPR